jgi:hypothetical protein
MTASADDDKIFFMAFLQRGKAATEIAIVISPQRHRS